MVKKNVRKLRLLIINERKRQILKSKILKVFIYHISTNIIGYFNILINPVIVPKMSV